MTLVFLSGVLVGVLAMVAVNHRDLILDKLAELRRK